MDKKVIATTNAPGAIGPYSQAWAVGDFVFASGQIPVNPATGEIPEGIAAQTEQAQRRCGCNPAFHRLYASLPLQNPSSSSMRTTSISMPEMASQRTTSPRQIRSGLLQS